MKNDNESDTGFFNYMLGFHILGGVTFLVLMILSLMEVATARYWWVWALLAFTSVLLGSAWFRVGVEIDILRKKIDELTK